VIDSHCHLAAKEFTEDIGDVIRRAHGAGIDRMIVIADTLTEAERGIVLAKTHENIFCTVGVHPHAAKDWDEKYESRISSMISSCIKVKSIGEIGLDYHYNFSDPEIQREVFRKQLEISKKLLLPCVVHCREAMADVRRIVEEAEPIRIVLHCCTEKFDDVEWFLKRGDYLSFTGMITYKNADVIRDTAKRTPIERIMIETDAPYLAPVPHRGKRNEPAYVTEVARAVAAIKGMSYEDVDRITTQNTVEFFQLPS
jgi:TatD DNase family protein